jgi:hypothetical protein
MMHLRSRSRLLSILAAAAAFLAPAQAQLDLELDRRDPDRAARAALFAAPDFPTVDAPELSAGELDAALDGLPVERITSVAELGERLRLAHYDVLILPHGSAFPLAAWPALRSFLTRGGGLVALGGAPFHQPVLGDDTGQ